MTDKEKMVERLSIFNHRSFTKKQWDIILEGCGCPKSAYFWNALKKNNLIKDTILYRLVGLNSETFGKIYEDYCKVNRANNSRHTARKKAQEKCRSFKGMTLFMASDGSLHSSIPERD